MITEKGEVFLKAVTPEVIWLHEDVSFHFKRKKFLALVDVEKPSKCGI